MSQVSRPMQIALAATLLLAAVWFVALRPKPTNGSAVAAGDVPAASPAAAATHTTAAGAAPGVAGLKSAIDKAHGAVATASGDAQRAAHSSADGAAPAPAPGPAASPSTAASGAAVPAATASTGRAPARAHAPAVHPRVGSQVAAVQAALRDHKAVAIAFVDPSTADGQAVAREMGGVSRFGGRALPLAVPLSALTSYGFITNAVQVTVAPTIVIVDPQGRATTIVGFADGDEIEQRLADALVTRRR